MFCFCFRYFIGKSCSWQQSSSWITHIVTWRSNHRSAKRIGLETNLSLSRSGDNDGSNVPYDDASSYDDEDDGDSCHSSHKSVEQCEWAAGFYHLHTYLPSQYQYQYLPTLPPTSYSTSNSLCQYQCNEFQYTIHGFAVVCRYLLVINYNL